MKVKIDKVAGAAYITLIKRIRKGGVMWTYHLDNPGPIDGDIALDFDKEGRLVGIEILDLRILHPHYMAEGSEAESHTR